MMGKLKKTLAVWAIRFALSALRLFWRVRYIDKPDDSIKSHVYAHYHGDELLLLPVFRNRLYAVMSSRSKDGDLMAALLASMGFDVVRGSSSRGGAGGLKGLIDAVRIRGRSAAIAVDGPRGPAFEVKPGIISLSQMTGVPIVPAGASCSRRWKIPGAWNQGYIPKPFSHCAVVFGEPLEVPAQMSEAQREDLRLELQRRLEVLRQRADRAVHVSDAALPVGMQT